MLADLTEAREQAVREVFADVHWTHRASQSREPELGLVPRDVLLLQWLADDLTIEAMARRGGVSADAMRNMVRRVGLHLGVGSRSAAVAKALRAGVIR